ncbi:NAD(P)/FAD-dependent oxidoreductase, partial [Planctomycetota bacterium]
METELCIIGAGPAGLTAAIFAAQIGTNTLILESNTSPGRKLLLTGAGRCNITHQSSSEELVRIFGNKGKFISYCLHFFSPDHVRNFF